MIEELAKIPQKFILTLNSVLEVDFNKNETVDEDLIDFVKTSLKNSSEDDKIALILFLVDSIVEGYKNFKSLKDDEAGKLRGFIDLYIFWFAILKYSGVGFKADNREIEISDSSEIVGEFVVAEIMHKWNVMKISKRIKTIKELIRELKISSSFYSYAKVFGYYIAREHCQMYNDYVVDIVVNFVLNLDMLNIEVLLTKIKLWYKQIRNILLMLEGRGDVKLAQDICKIIEKLNDEERKVVILRLINIAMMDFVQDLSEIDNIDKFLISLIFSAAMAEKIGLNLKEMIGQEKAEIRSDLEKIVNELINKIADRWEKTKLETKIKVLSEIVSKMKDKSYGISVKVNSLYLKKLYEIDDLIADIAADCILFINKGFVKV